MLLDSRVRAPAGNVADLDWALIASICRYCGKTTDHCDKFCNNIFGECIPPPTAGFPLPPVFSASNIPALAPSTAPCTRPSVRREFRTLTKTQRDNYIKAVKCLRTQPSKFPANLGTKSAYDDLVYVHMLIEKLGHMTAVFLPWHRVFSLNFESLLRGMCGYTDPLPYWDASIDSQAPEKSPVWAVDFMGGNGDASTGCVKTGPFAGNIVNVPKPHCLQRAFYRDPDYGSMLSALYTPTELAYAFSSATNYDTFRQLFESLIHNSVHTGVSGDMYSLNTSPNDPIFFLHHPNVDRLWWVWQNKFDKNRNQYGGMRSKTLDSASLTDRVPMFGLGQDFLIKDVLNTVGGGRFCYIYDNSAAPAVSSTSLAKIDLNDTPLPRGSPVVNTSSVPVVGSGSVTVAVQPLNGTASPGPFDRGDKHHLRHHAPIPDDFLRKMGHTAETIARVRANEAKLNKLVDMLNAETDKGRFLSQAALVITESGRVSFVAPSAGDAAKRQSALESLAAKALDELGPLAA
ncbi:hypothetical protein HK105_201809 [Polyrhizophydium stewartii]|uniref:Tyrosinase copper-binding domain-containing protein n=2 Tax=Polyrhizophydium stewartii TaxID=2732419 RepID=A0ABR4NG22_9FUNG